MKKWEFLVFAVLFLFFILFSSCTVGDLYRNYQLKKREEYIENVIPTLDPLGKEIAADLKNQIGFPLYFGLLEDSIMFIGFAVDSSEGLTDPELLRSAMLGYFLLSGIYDTTIFSIYSESPKEWFDKRFKKIYEKEVYLKSKYGRWCDYIKEGVIVIGMPKEVVKEILGQPDDINKTVTSNTVFEQWVYEKYDYTLKIGWPYLYLYFENGILKSWQEVN